MAFTALKKLALYNNYLEGVIPEVISHIWNSFGIEKIDFFAEHMYDDVIIVVRHQYQYDVGHYSSVHW